MNADSTRALSAALQYAQNGWPVFPAETGGKAPISELAPHGVYDATTDATVIAAWWQARPNATVAIAVGSPADLGVIDVDVRDDGIASLDALLAEHESLPSTFSVNTGGGGRHYYFTFPKGVELSNRTAVRPGIDFKWSGGYVIAPPSVHVSGRTYEVLDNVDITQAPEWLVELLTKPKRERSAGIIQRHGQGASAWADVAFTSECERVSAAMEGERNATLNRAAFSLGQIAGSGYLDRDRVHDALLAAAETCGLIADDGERACTKTIESGLRAGESDPRHPVESAHEKVRVATVRAPETAELVQDAATDMTDVAPFPTIDVERYALEGIPPIEWLREPWIAREDVGIVYGAPYIGKTTWVLSLGAAIAAGTTFLGSPAKDPTPVLVIDGEAGERSTVRRAMRCGAPIDGLYLVSAGGALALLDAGCVRRLHRTISDLQPTLLILDSVSTTFGLTNENDSPEVRAAMQELFIVRDKFKCATLATHHVTKAPVDGRNARGALDMMRGSSAFGAMASLALYCKTTPDRKAMDVEITKARDRDLRGHVRRIEEVRAGDLSALQIIEGAEAAETILDQVSRALVDHMTLAVDYRTRDLIAALGKDEHTVGKALAHLKAVGRAESPKRGIWRIVGGPKSAGGREVELWGE